MKNKPINRNRWVSLGLIIVFIGPLLTAFIVYFFRAELNLKTHNTGFLISPPILASSLALQDLDALGQWQLVYLKPKECDEDCRKFEKTITAIHTALGKDRNRVQLKKLPFSGVTDHLIQEGVIIIDPKGWLMMYYPIPLSSPKGILQDIRLLLKNSHVG